MVHTVTGYLDTVHGFPTTGTVLNLQAMGTDFKAHSVETVADSKSSVY